MKDETSQRHMVEFSIGLPAYNEANTLENAVTKVMKALEEFAHSYEIIIAEDGSTDGTDKVAALLSERYPLVKHLHIEKRLGRGAALKNAFKKASGKILVYMDVDLATNVGQLESLVKAIEEEEYDLAVGSRMLSKSRVERSRTRHLFSIIYNFMVRAMLGSKVKDHQCGFKAFRREPLMQLLDEVAASHWFWDTELIVRAFRKGYTIKEIPVEWTSGHETKVRLIEDSFDMAWQVIKLWWQLKWSS
ncbi:MAG: glycosyltransferase family 2 protein [Candidatus Bathyarchaeum sp.]|nr:MAG: glycosyltransferase family 2 protein [Candidatus Bathyarchaeum sp.]